MEMEGGGSNIFSDSREHTAMVSGPLGEQHWWPLLSVLGQGLLTAQLESSSRVRWAQGGREAASYGGLQQRRGPPPPGPSISYQGKGGTVQLKGLPGPCGSLRNDWKAWERQGEG